ncbi:MAG: glycosyl hydrolase family 28 protein [Armatimonadota bacterium]
MPSVQERDDAAMDIADTIVPNKFSGRYTVYASTYAKLDSDVINGGGTDDTEVIQAILDKAPEWGGLHLIMDGAALVRGLEIYSNTTIECKTKDCGFFLASGSNRSIIQNVHLDFKTRHDKNITLLGGTYNQNCNGQEHHIMLDSDSKGVFGAEKWVIGMEFYGVEHLTMRDVTIRNQRTFAMLVANWYRVTMENITIELPDNMFGQNQDGIHFWGPGQFLNMRNIMGCSGDDFIALAPDENDNVSNITDVVIDGVFLNDADQGIRLLSRAEGRLDRVIIRNVTGTFKSFGFYINPWFPGSGGNFGNITFENIDLRQTKHKYDYATPFLFRIGGNIETLTLKGIHHNSPANPLRLIDLGIPFYTPNDEHTADYSHIHTLILDDLQIFDKSDSDIGTSYIKVLCPVDSIVVRNSHVKVSEVSQNARLIETSEHANIGCIHISGLTVDGMNTLIDHPAGKIETVCLNDVLCINTSGPLIAGEGEIGVVQSNAVFGAHLKR